MEQIIHWWFVWLLEWRKALLAEKDMRSDSRQFPFRSWQDVCRLASGKVDKEFSRFPPVAVKISPRFKILMKCLKNLLRWDIVYKFLVTLSMWSVLKNGHFKVVLFLEVLKERHLRQLHLHYGGFFVGYFDKFIIFVLKWWKFLLQISFGLPYHNYLMNLKCIKFPFGFKF